MAISFCAQAQYVTIPDVNFRNALIQLFPSCFNGSQQMDTTCSGVVSAQQLFMDNKSISNLDGVQYFDGLTYLSVENNLLNSLPPLPSTLAYLDYDSNNITVFPVLPSNLGDLRCDGNNISYIPSIPPNLFSFFCGNNLLTSLPNLPNNLRYFGCDNNLLTTLPALPNSLEQFTFTNNFYLSCLPLLPNSIYYFQDSLTGVTCLPNIPSGLSTSLPICSIGSSCEPNPTASGLIFHDINFNGIYNLGIDSTLKGWIVNNTNGWAANSMQNGEFITKLDSGVVNTLTLSSLTLYVQSINPNSIQITPTSSGSNNNFAVHFIPNIQDLRVDIAAGFARPGFDQWCTSTVNNVGTMDVNNATLKVLKPATFVFQNANPSISQQVGDTLIWNNINIGMLQHKGFDINWNVPANSILGAPYQIQAWINPISTDTTPINNHVIWDGVFQGSYDPNDKVVNNRILEPADLNNELKYTIRFQNTGTDTAFTVMIRDTLSNNLDMSTFRILGASHNYSFIVRDHSLLEVFFQNILLPDSFTNEPKSHGFVQYAIKPKSLAVGEEINNTAYIFFDFNVPIVTNTTNTRIVTTSISDGISIDADIYPNPNNGKVRVALKSPHSLTSPIGEGEQILLTISDLSGRVVLIENVRNNSEVDLSDLSNGMYLAKIETKNGFKMIKLVKE